METTELIGEHTPPPPSARRRKRTFSRRLVLAQVLALVGLIATLIGALGPADHIRSTYSWPPRDLPVATPDRLWYSPLLLIRHRPAAISATIPCSLPPPLPDADRPVMVLATARSPQTAGGLAIVREGERAVVTVEGQVFGRVLLTNGATSDCGYRLRLGGGRWSLEGGPDTVALGGSLESSEMPVVNGLFSALDLRTGPTPAIDVTTTVHATRTRLRQTVAWTVAALCIFAALLLVVASERRPRPWPATRHALKGAAARAHPADAVVAVVLLVWWVLSPVTVDDGWIVVREQMYSVSGGFSAYYNTFGTNLPNDYWLEWTHHWLSQSSDTLILLRVPVLAFLAASWMFCRWMLARIITSSVGRDDVSLWALTAAFLVGALAWGMTLRPEPVTALLVTASLACVLRFLDRETIAPLAALAVLVPLAATAHHAGIAAIAPVLAAAPSLARWARPRIPVASTLVAASVALLATLLFVGSDLDTRTADARLTSSYGSAHTTWRDEVVRYASLSSYPGGTPLRRASVALITLALLAFVLRRRHESRALLDLPARALGIGLILFIAAPTKSPWHFGALLGVTAVAIAAETARLRGDAARSRGWQPRPLIAIGAAILAIAWSWSPRSAWSTLDLRTLDWTPRFENRISLSLLAALVPLFLLAAAALIELFRKRRDRLRWIPWRVATWTSPLLAAPLIVFTVALFAADTAKTGAWTLTRQNLGSLRGDGGCGIGDDLLVPVQDSAQPLQSAESGKERAAAAWIPASPTGLAHFALGPTGSGTGTSPWFELPAGRRFGLYISGMPGPSEFLELEWGRLRAVGIGSLGADGVSTAFTSEARASLPWRFVAAAELPPARNGANAVRIRLRRDMALGTAVAVTVPVTYESEEIAQRLSGNASRSLVMPYVLPYLPCAELPPLRDGIAESPRLIVVSPTSPSPVGDRGTSPFAGLLDLYRLERMPLADSKNPPRDIVVFAVDRRIPGAIRAPAAETTVAS